MNNGGKKPKVNRDRFSPARGLTSPVYCFVRDVFGFDLDRRNSPDDCVEVTLRFTTVIAQ